MNKFDDLSIAEALVSAKKQLENKTETPGLDAELLLCHVLDCERVYLMTWPEKQLTDEHSLAFDNLICARVKGHPIAHILGQREFWDLTLKCNNSTLIPRPDTELLVEVVLDKALHFDKSGKTFSGLDLGTGTGAIALALAKEIPNSQWTGVDRVQDAIELAQENAKLNLVTNCQFLQSQWFTEVKDHAFSVIVSNPPYIDPTDPHLHHGDVRFEPLSALIADNKGLADIEFISKHAQKYLVDGGMLAFEHGFDQGAAVRQILDSNGFQSVETFKDLSGNDRVSIGYFS